MRNNIDNIQQLETIDYIKQQWQYEGDLFRNKQHPSDFPALPELPAARYIDPVFFELEKQHLWQKTWIFAGVSNEIANIGDYKTLEILGSPVILTRDDSNEIKAFRNVCQHRGARLCSEPKGHKNSFVCPYHGWNYTLSGELRHVPAEHEFPNLDKNSKPLSSIRCEQLGNLIFINFDTNADNLTDHFGNIAELMADIPFDQVELHDSFSWKIGANWKCGQDAFAETYHARFVHAQTANAAIDTLRTVKYLFEKGHCAMNVKARGGEKDSIYRASEVATHQMKPLTSISQRAFNLFPNLTIPVSENVFTIIEIMPLSVSESLINLYYLKIPSAECPDLDTVADEAVAAFKPVIEEDLAILGNIHKSIASGGLSSVPLSYSEQFLYNHHLYVDQFIGIENIPEKYQVTPVELPIIQTQNVGQ